MLYKLYAPKLIVSESGTFPYTLNKRIIRRTLYYVTLLYSELLQNSIKLLCFITSRNSHQNIFSAHRLASRPNISDYRD